MKSPVILFLLSLLTAQVTSANTITATSTADSGPGTLRAALAGAANGDTIFFSLTTPATITLTSGELLVTKNLNILGPGPNNLAVNGNFPNTTNRVFHIGPGKTVTISGLTITNGFATGDDLPAVAGGGICNDQAILTVSNCIVSGNSGQYGGGGIYNIGKLGSATLRTVNCAFSGNSAGSFGGGIWNSAENSGSVTLTISNCTFNGNSAHEGGGIYNLGINGGSATAVIASSTVSGNSDQYGGGSGGGSANDGYSGSVTLTIVKCSFSSNSTPYGLGGGIYGRGAAVSILNSTFSGNSAQYGLGGGFFIEGGSLSATDSTISGNSAGHGGGIYNSGGGGKVGITNCTLSGNSAEVYGGGIVNDDWSGFGNATLELGSTILKAGAGPNITNVSGTVTSRGYNLSSDGAGGFLTATGDQINTDPKLGPLRDNGGPTFTHALLLGSPAIDKGKNLSGSATDQRGRPRPYDNPAIPNATFGDGTDIGAFEYIPPALAIARNFGNMVLSWPTNDPGYKVESTTVLSNSANWITVPGTPLIIGDQYLLGDGPVIGKKFYRLRSP